MTKAAKSEAQLCLEAQLRELGIAWVAEWRFAPPRRWRFDYASSKLAIEIEGGVWSRGRHTTGKGFQADLEKYNTATAMGYTLFRFSTEDVLKGRSKAFLAQWLQIAKTALHAS